MLLIALCTVLSGGETCADMALFGVGFAGADHRGRGIVEEASHVVKQRRLVALQRQHVVAALLDHLPGTCRAICRWQLSASAVTIIPFSDSNSNSFGTATISFDLSPTASCPSTRR